MLRTVQSTAFPCSESRTPNKDSVSLVVIMVSILLILRKININEHSQSLSEYIRISIFCIRSPSLKIRIDGGVGYCPGTICSFVRLQFLMHSAYIHFSQKCMVGEDAKAKKIDALAEHSYGTFVRV